MTPPHTEGSTPDPRTALERAAQSNEIVDLRCGCSRSKWVWTPCKRHYAAMIADFAEGD